MLNSYWSKAKISQKLIQSYESFDSSMMESMQDIVRLWIQDWSKAMIHHRGMHGRMMQNAFTISFTAECIVRSWSALKNEWNAFLWRRADFWQTEAA